MGEYRIGSIKIGTFLKVSEDGIYITRFPKAKCIITGFLKVSAIIIGSQKRRELKSGVRFWRKTGIVEGSFYGCLCHRL